MLPHRKLERDGAILLDSVSRFVLCLHCEAEVETGNKFGAKATQGKYCASAQPNRLLIKKKGVRNNKKIICSL